MDLINKFKEYIKKELLIETGDAVLLGVSGGPDSLTMLDLFNRIRDEFNLEVVVFHLDHKFRSEAAAEAEFVAGVCNELQIKVIVEEFDVPSLVEEEGLSPEEAARNVRFEKMRKQAANLNIKKVALAHNKDDLVETIFLHLFRGTGLKGLSGIDPVNEMKGIIFIHPLLNIFRQEIEEYCQARSLNPRYDPSNEKTIYTRNKIRHNIIPYIEKEINPGLKDVMYQMSNIVREEHEFLNQQAEMKLAEVVVEQDNLKIVLSLPGLKEISGVLRRRIIQKVVYRLKEKSVDLYYEHFRAVQELIFYSNTGKKLDLPDDIKVKRSYDKLIFRKGEFLPPLHNYNFELHVPGSVQVPGDKMIITEYVNKEKNWRLRVGKSKICFCDLDKVSLPLKVRNRRAGDRFCPLGMDGFKKVKDFFIDEKIPRIKRDEIPIIFDNRDRIIWIAGIRIDDRFKVDEKTKKLIKICLKNEEGAQDEK